MHAGSRSLDVFPEGGSDPDPTEVIVTGTDSTIAGVAFNELVLQQGWCKSVLTQDDATAPVQLVALRALAQGHRLPAEHTHHTRPKWGDVVVAKDYLRICSALIESKLLPAVEPRQLFHGPTFHALVASARDLRSRRAADVAASGPTAAGNAAMPPPTTTDSAKSVEEPKLRYCLHDDCLASTRTFKFVEALKQHMDVAHPGHTATFATVHAPGGKQTKAKTAEKKGKGAKTKKKQQQQQPQEERSAPAPAPTPTPASVPATTNKPNLAVPNLPVEMCPWKQPSSNTTPSPSKPTVKGGQQGVAVVSGGSALPIDAYRQEILTTIATHRVTIIQGETGCGKSTRVPVMLLEYVALSHGMSHGMVHLVIRRLYGCARVDALHSLLTVARTTAWSQPTTHVLQLA